MGLSADKVPCGVPTVASSFITTLYEGEADWLTPILPSRVSRTTSCNGFAPLGWTLNFKPPPKKPLPLSLKPTIAPVLTNWPLPLHHLCVKQIPLPSWLLPSPLWYCILRPKFVP